MPASGFDYKKYLYLINKNKGMFVAISLTIMTLAVMISFLLPKKYEAKSTVFIEKNVIGELVKGITVSPSMDDTIKVLTYALSSRALVLKVINELDFNLKTKSDADTEQLLKDLQRDTSITVKDKDLFTISFKHSNPRIARDYVNTLVRSYIESNVAEKREESYNATKFLAEQISTFKERTDKAESAVTKYKTDKGGLATVDEGRLMQDINSAQQKLYELQLRRKLLEGQLALTKKSSDPLQVKLVAMKKRLDELRVDYTDNYPEVQSLKSHIESLQEEMKGRTGGGTADPQELWKIETELAAVKEGERNLQQNIASNRQLLGSIPTTKAGLDKLEAEKTNQKNIYDLLYLRHDQSEVSKQMELQDKSTTFRIVDPAVTPVMPVSPDRKKIMLMGIIGGLACGLGFVLLRDYLDHSVTTVGALRNFGLPVLAVIPLIVGKEEIAIERKKALHLYLVSGVYFSLILAVLIMELLGITLVDTLMSNLNLPPLAAKVMKRLM
jgi:succinoglycan biosynthesis transport protein ExoP